jgi:branched-subunit amino acid transport protein AzlD
VSDSLLVLAVMASITFTSRLLPFLFFSRNHPPRWLASVETLLPPLVLWLLVFYSLSSIAWRTTPYGIPALASVAIVVLVYRWKHNALLSILSGTGAYMILTRVLA